VHKNGAIFWPTLFKHISGLEVEKTARNIGKNVEVSVTNLILCN